MFFFQFYGVTCIAKIMKRYKVKKRFWLILIMKHLNAQKRMTVYRGGNLV